MIIGKQNLECSVNTMKFFIEIKFGISSYIYCCRATNYTNVQDICYIICRYNCLSVDYRIIENKMNQFFAFFTIESIHRAEKVLFYYTADSNIKNLQSILHNKIIYIKFLLSSNFLF